MSIHNVPRLAIRPRPVQEESLSNYCLRVSESNGYFTPAMMLTMAGVASRNHVGINESDKVAKLVDVDPSLLRSMAYMRKEDEKQGTWRRGEHQYRPCEVTPRFTRICPACIQELGYARAIWDVRLVVACPKHQTLLLDTCPNCGKTLTWMRRGLLTCSCGHRINSDTCLPAPEWTSRVASLIEGAILGTRKDLDSTWLPHEVMQLPPEDLLPFLTYWTTILSRRLDPSADKVLTHRTGFAVSDLSEVLNMAGQAVAEWPLSHAHTIARLFERHRHHGNHVKRANFLNVVGASWVWAQSDNAPAILCDEVRTYLAERTIYNAKGRVCYLHPRQIIPFAASNSVKSGIGLLSAAKQLGVGEDLVLRLAEHGFIKKFEKETPSSCAATYDLDSVLSIKPYILATLDFRASANELAISTRQFGSMVRHGLLEVAIGRKRTTFGSRFRRDDIAALNARFSELAMGCHDQGHLDFSHGVQVKSFWPNGQGIKQDREFGPIVKAILSGKVLVAPPSHHHRGIGEYLLDLNSLVQSGFRLRPEWLRISRAEIDAGSLTSSPQKSESAQRPRTRSINSAQSPSSRDGTSITLRRRAS
jgi:hypothetical protein